MRRKTIEMLYTWLHDTIASETVLHVTTWKLGNKVKTTKLTIENGEWSIVFCGICLCSALQQGSHLLHSSGATQRVKRTQTENELLDCDVMHFLPSIA